MGLFSSSTPKKQLPWTRVDSVEHLIEISKTTFEKPVLLFKHSTRCGVSAMVLKSFESQWATENELCGLYFVDLLKHRDVSDEIASITGVYHQSPQVIVLKGSEVIYDESHSAIDARRIEKSLKNA